MIPPKNIHCLALNYTGVGAGDTPLYFVKSYNSLNIDATRVIYPNDVTELWTEVELGVVIAEDCSNISGIEADDFISGFTICADITAKNINNRDHHLAFSKSRSGFCPVSSTIVKISSAEYKSLKLRTYINGELTQEGLTEQMILDPFECVSYISSLTNLCKGDLILTGTPMGVVNNIIEKGDVIQQEIECVGTLEYKIV
jgi:5-oxopent-3-ene-1,2,5-tricarboxylate decarboxylase/2-hydroxyhepta-2,4-diene-1,7-dioate isomerase